MDLSSYPRTTASHAQELTNAIEDLGIETLRDVCRRVGRKAVQEFFESNKELTLQFLTMTPRQRQSAHKRLDEPTRLVLFLCALVRAKQAFALMDALERNNLELGLSYRQMTANAASAFSDVVDASIDLWPLPAPNPFRRGSAAQKQS